MRMKLFAYLILGVASALSTHGNGCTNGSGQPSVSVASTSPFALDVQQGTHIVQNSAILLGSTNSSVAAVSASKSGSLQGGGQISAAVVNDQVVKISVNSTSSFVGARLRTADESKFFGVWEYPWYRDEAYQIDNAGISFELKGVGNSEGGNWQNARAPFFFTDAGYGVYADSLDMSSWNFTQPGQAEFIFNASSLVYYVILPETQGDYKSILEAYISLSAAIEMPPDSSYGPTFWSDNFEQDFHDGVTNAQENYYDVINHLYYKQIHASSMFADRPYGTGNYSFGNFGPIGSATSPFDPVYYPTPVEFIANLSHWGFDYQVWVANRAFLDNELYNASVANGWLFPGIDPQYFLGPALNLSIPEAYAYFKEKLSIFPQLGVKGYKIDRGEEGEMPVWEQNIQMDLFIQLCYETMEEHWGPSNFYDFARSAGDRSRAKTAIWNGDSHASANFSGLQNTVASGIRAGLIGFSQWGSDTGGYIRDMNDPIEELWARWMWFSTFSPVYEIMIGTNHTPWYPPYSSDLLDVLKTTANMHHDLLPYIKSYTYQASQTGVPVMRAGFLETPTDAKTLEIVDSYYFGSELFIAPIVTAGGKRTVYFPGCADDKYLDYFDKLSVHTGGSTVNVSMDVHSVPAYVKAGSIVPRGDIFQFNNKWTEHWQPELTIELYPASHVKTSTFQYYNGDSNKVAPITMAIDELSGCVRLDYGALGVNGTFVLYAKHGSQNATLHASGGSVQFGQVASLFD